MGGYCRLLRAVKSERINYVMVGAFVVAMVAGLLATIVGSNVLFGPGVQVYTAAHPMNASDRRTWREFAQPVKIGSDVWVGGGAIICPGVRIGSRSVIGAGSVVTNDIPEDVFAAGNPCRLIRRLDN